MPDARSPDRETVHELKNHMGVVVSFAQLLLRQLPASEPGRSHVLAIDRAARAALDAAARL
jgi:hypothetical protein